MFPGHGELAVGGRAAQNDLVSAFNTGAIIKAGQCQDSFRRVLCLLYHEGMVHEKERLWRYRAGVAVASDHARIRKIKNLEKVRQRIAENRNVHAAAQISVFVSVVGARSGFDGRTADFKLKLTA